METASGVYPLLPRLPVQLGKVSCQVFNVFDNDGYVTTTVLVTVSQATSYVVYECVFHRERNEFKIFSVYNKLINNIIGVPKEMNEIFGLEESQETKFPLIAKIPEKNIYAYGINPHGVVIYDGSAGQFYDWNYLTPRRILPQIASADFNRDGIDEIGVSLYYGSGTGVSVEQLHVLEKVKDSFGHYDDYEFKQADYMEQLEDILQYEYNPDTKMLTLKIYNKTYQYQCAGEFGFLDFSSIVDFEFENGKIKGIFHLGIGYKGRYTFEYKLGTLVADVVYETGIFTLSNLELNEE